MSSAAYVDFNSLTHLRTQAEHSPRSSLKEVARQFESLFAHMLLKNVRSASLGDTLFDSKQSKFFRDMYDQQMSMELTKGRGLGLADTLVKQLEQYVPPDQTKIGSASISESKKSFLNQLLPMAKRAAAKLGVSEQGILAQAALETGWGKRVFEVRPGISSHNVFGIKADPSWKGDKLAVKTLEVVDGNPHQVFAPFRVYSTLENAFQDYVLFLTKNPRYNDVLGEKDPAAFAEKIQNAGYATDPDYSRKLISILNSADFKGLLKDF
ncbi:MAG: glucosaminidase domain-containing protein [Pseudomonadota bacterium]